MEELIELTNYCLSCRFSQVSSDINSNDNIKAISCQAQDKQSKECACQCSFLLMNNFCKWHFFTDKKEAIVIMKN